MNTGMPTANHGVSHNGDYTTIPAGAHEDDVLCEVAVDDDEPIIEVLGAEYGDQDLNTFFCSEEESFVLVDVMSEDDIADDDVIVEADFSVEADDVIVEPDVEVELDDDLQDDSDDVQIEEVIEVDDDMQIDDDFVL